MNVYEYAMKVEKDGEAYYRELASKAPNKGLKRVFTLLADAEVKHYKVFKNMLDKEHVDANTMDIMTDTKTIFETLSEEQPDASFQADEVEYYEEAIKREDDAYIFYLNKANELEDEQERIIFLKIAQEEMKHKEVLENILSFIQAPQNWVGSAEF